MRCILSCHRHSPPLAIAMTVFSSWTAAALRPRTAVVNRRCALACHVQQLRSSRCECVPPPAVAVLICFAHDQLITGRSPFCQICRHSRLVVTQLPYHQRPPSPHRFIVEAAAPTLSHACHASIHVGASAFYRYSAHSAGCTHHSGLFRSLSLCQCVSRRGTSLGARGSLGGPHDHRGVGGTDVLEVPVLQRTVHL